MPAAGDEQAHPDAGTIGNIAVFYISIIHDTTSL